MVRLLVLWILSEKPSYGYEIKKALSDDAMTFWFGVEDASIYSALRTLAKHGYARELGIEKDGARPQRTRYALTAAGRGYYGELLLEALANPILPVGPIDVALAARGDLSAAKVREALARRSLALTQQLAAIGKVAAGTPSTAIVSRNQALLKAEKRWLAKLDQTTIT